MRWLALAVLVGCTNKDKGEDTGPQLTCTWTEVTTLDVGHVLFGIGADGGDVLLAGKSDALHGQIWRGNASGFTPDSPATELRGELADVDRGVAVGTVSEGLENPQLMAWNGTGGAWSETLPPVDGRFTAVAAGSGQAYAVGQTNDGEWGLVWRYSDGQWQDLDLTGKTNPFPTYGVVVRGADDAILVGSDLDGEAAIWWWDGTDFATEYPTTPALLAAWWDGSTTWAAGRDGTVLVDEGGAFQERSTGLSGDLLGISGADGAVYVVGTGGVAARWEDGSWTTLDSGVGDDLVDVVAMTANEAYAITSDPVGSAVWRVSCS